MASQANDGDISANLQLQKKNASMCPVTIVCVYQDSMPWFGLVLQALDMFGNDVGKPYVFLVENRPCPAEARKAAEEFVNRYHACQVMPAPPLPAKVPRGYSRGSMAHVRGMEYTFPRIGSEWTLFLDADCVPIREGWLDHMLATGGDMVGPSKPEEWFRSVERWCSFDPAWPHVHPAMLLFRTVLGRKPYWDGTFGKWYRRQQTGKSELWDVAMPFTYTVGSRKDVKLVNLPQRAIRIGEECCHEIDGVAIHLQGTSNIRDGGPKGRRLDSNSKKMVFLRLPDFSFSNRRRQALGK